MESSFTMVRNFVSILQHNIQHSVGATEGLIKDLHDRRGPFICLVQEPYLYRQDIKLFPRGVQVCHGLTDKGPRACILSSPDMGLVLVPQADVV